MFAADDNEMRPEHRVEANALPFIVVEMLCNLMLFQTMMAIMIKLTPGTKSNNTQYQGR
jgi:hypothetical protein